MEESSYEIDPAQLAEVSRLFPAHRDHVSSGDTHAVAAGLAAVPVGDFASHAWDEAGAL